MAEKRDWSFLNEPNNESQQQALQADGTLHCPHCRGEILNDQEFAGQVVLCPHCNRKMKFPKGGVDAVDQVPTIDASEAKSARGTALFLHGLQGKSLIVDGPVIRLMKKTQFLEAERQKTIPIKNITSVEVKKPGLAFGFMQFSIAGGFARDSSHTLTGGAWDALSDENSIVFDSQFSYKMALRIKQYVENYSEAPISTTTVQSLSIADEILKLKGLSDQGIITPDEFESKKRQLLDG